MQDPWQPPRDPGPVREDADGSPRLVYVVEREWLDAQVNAWTRRNPLFSWPVRVLLVPVFAIAVNEFLGAMLRPGPPLLAATLLVPVVLAPVLLLLPEIRRDMEWRAHMAGGAPEAPRFADVIGDDLVLGGPSGEMRVPRWRVARVHEHESALWLRFDNGVAVFLPRHVSQGSVGAFLQALRTGTAAEPPASIGGGEHRLVIRRAPLLPHLWRSLRVRYAPQVLPLSLGVSACLLGIALLGGWSEGTEGMVATAAAFPVLTLLLSSFRVWRSRRHLRAADDRIEMALDGSTFRYRAADGGSDVAISQIRRVVDRGSFTTLHVGQEALILPRSDVLEGDLDAFRDAIEAARASRTGGDAAGAERAGR